MTSAERGIESQCCDVVHRAKQEAGSMREGDVYRKRGITPTSETLFMQLYI